MVLRSSKGQDPLVGAVTTFGDEPRNMTAPDEGKGLDAIVLAETLHGRAPAVHDLENPRGHPSAGGRGRGWGVPIGRDRPSRDPACCYWR